MLTISSDVRVSIFLVTFSDQDTCITDSDLFQTDCITVFLVSFKTFKHVTEGDTFPLFFAGRRKRVSQYFLQLVEKLRVV